MSYSVIFVNYVLLKKKTIAIGSVLGNLFIYALACDIVEYEVRIWQVEYKVEYYRRRKYERKNHAVPQDYEKGKL